MGFHAWLEAHDNAEQETEEVPQERHIWYAPFYKASSSGLVDGGRITPKDDSTTGDVSE